MAPESKFGIGPKIPRKRFAAVPRLRPGDVVCVHPVQRLPVASLIGSALWLSLVVVAINWRAAVLVAVLAAALAAVNRS